MRDCDAVPLPHVVDHVVHALHALHDAATVQQEKPRASEFEDVAEPAQGVPPHAAEHVRDRDTEPVCVTHEADQAVHADQTPLIAFKVVVD